MVLGLRNLEHKGSEFKTNLRYIVRFADSCQTGGNVSRDISGTRVFPKGILVFFYRGDTGGRR